MKQGFGILIWSGFLLQLVGIKSPEGCTRLFLCTKEACVAYEFCQIDTDGLFVVSRCRFSWMKQRCCGNLKSGFSQKLAQKHTGGWENSTSCLQTQMRLFIWQPFTCQDLMQCTVTTGPTTRRHSLGLRLTLGITEALLQELSQTGINGRAVYLNQIRSNPSLALHCCSAMDDRCCGQICTPSSRSSFN